MKKYKILFIIVSLLYIFFLSSCTKNGTPIDSTPKTPSDNGEIDSTYYYDLETHYHMKNGQKTDVAEHTFGRDAVCVRCGFPLFAYAKELNEDTAPYILQIGEEITPVSYHGSQVISFRFVSSNPDVVSTTSTGKIKALKVGSATISAYFQDVLESSINVEVIAKEQISINTNYMDEFTSLLNSFNDEKEFSINFYTLIGDKKEGCEIKYSENPFYYQYNIISN